MRRCVSRSSAVTRTAVTASIPWAFFLSRCASESATYRGKDGHVVQYDGKDTQESCFGAAGIALSEENCESYPGVKVLLRLLQAFIVVPWVQLGYCFDSISVRKCISVVDVIFEYR